MDENVVGSSEGPRQDVDRAHVRAVASALLPHTDRLGDDLVRHILEEEPAYAELSVVAMDDLRRSCRANIARVVQALVGHLPADVDPYDATAATGRRRAAQGMPLEAVLHSYRLGGRLIWDGIVALAADDAADPGNRALLRMASLVWEEIDRFSMALAQAYRDEESRLRSQHRHQQQRDVSALLAGDLDERELAPLAERLGFPDATSVVAVTVLVEDPDAPMFAVADSLAGRGVHAAWAVATGAETALEVGLVRLGGRGRRGLRDLLEPVTRQRLGISPALTSLLEGRGAVRLAELAARTLPAAGVAMVEDRLPHALVLDAPGLAALVLERTVDVLAARADGAGLLSTVDALLAESGSFSRAAARLFVHRNTVIHRASRVATLSGHDPLTPQGALLWSLALLAEEQRGRTKPSQPAGGRRPRGGVDD